MITSCYKNQTAILTAVLILLNEMMVTSECHSSREADGLLWLLRGEGSVIFPGLISHMTTLPLSVFCQYMAAARLTSQGETSGVSTALWLIQWDSQGGDDVYHVVKTGRNV